MFQKGNGHTYTHTITNILATQQNKHKVNFIKERQAKKQQTAQAPSSHQATERWLQLDTLREVLQDRDLPCAAGGMGMATMKGFRLRTWLCWKRGPPELSKGSYLHATPKILLLGLAGPVPRSQLLHCPKRGRDKKLPSKT